MKSLTVREKKSMAQELIMNHLAAVCYGNAYDNFVLECGGQEKADEIMISQMNRVAKLFGYEKAWFY